MQLSFLNEFTYFSNDEAIDRVVTKDGVRFVKLKDDETPYGLNELIQNISSEMFIVSDLHIGDPIDNWTDKRDKIISTINNIVGKNDKLLILGDLTAHSNTTNIYDIVNFIKCLKCENLYLVLGNNDIYSIDSYKRMGFKAVVDKVIWRNYIFTHMPIRVTGKEINIHGHLHEEIRYENVDWHNHIRIWDDEYKPIKFREILIRFESGYYKGVTMTSDELKAEWEAKQKIEEIETSINSVFDEIEKLSEEYDLPYVMKNIYDNDLSKSIIPLYEYNTYPIGDASDKHNILVTKHDQLWGGVLNNSPTYEKSCMVDQDFQIYQHNHLDDIMEKLTLILASHKTDDINYYMEKNPDNPDVTNIFAEINDTCCESLSVLTGKYVTMYRTDKLGRVFQNQGNLLSGTYMNSVVMNLYTYDYAFDHDLKYRRTDVVKLYSAYVDGYVYGLIHQPRSKSTRNIDEMIYAHINTLVNKKYPDKVIIQKIKEEFFSDYKSKTEILKNVNYRLQHFYSTLKIIKATLGYNVLSADTDIQQLIDMRSDPTVMMNIRRQYSEFVPKLKLTGGEIIQVPNGGRIIISRDYYHKQLLPLDRQSQIDMLVSPIWYALNGYDFVILGHGYTRSQFIQSYGRDYNYKNGSVDDFYIQPIEFYNKTFFTLNSLLDYIHNNWSEETECKIMVLVCNEDPDTTLPKLIKTYNTTEFDNINVIVSDNPVILESLKYNSYDIDNTQDLYNEVIVYCDYLLHDIDTLKSSILNRIKILDSIGIVNFYHFGKRINADNGIAEAILYQSVNDLRDNTIDIIDRFTKEIDKVIRINICYLSAVNNYIHYTGTEPVYNKAAFIGIKTPRPNVRINEYSDCLTTEYNDEIIVESTEQKYIYVCAFRYKSFFSSMVQIRTASRYNHAAISLKEDLYPMYTYVRENPRGKTKYDNKNGFSHEFLSDLLQKDPESEMKVIAIPVTDEQYETAEALIQGYVNNIEDTSYDFGNVVASMFNMKRNVYDLPETSMVCSEFVSYILYSIGFRGMSKSVNLTTPKDISQLDKKFIGAKCIYEGKVKDYKK